MDRRDFILGASATASAMLPARPAGAGSDRRLGDLRAITIAAPDVHAIEAAYGRYLGFRKVWRGSVSHETALSWGAPSVA